MNRFVFACLALGLVGLALPTAKAEVSEQDIDQYMIAAAHMEKGQFDVAIRQLEALKQSGFVESEGLLLVSKALFLKERPPQEEVIAIFDRIKEIWQTHVMIPDLSPNSLPPIGRVLG